MEDERLTGHLGEKDDPGRTTAEGGRTADAGVVGAEGKAATDMVAGVGAIPTPMDPGAALDQGTFAAERDFIDRGYGIIELDTVHNCRDLGGLPGADGRRVAMGRLVRSGALGHGSDGDLARLIDRGLSCVVDFRTDDERAHDPEPAERLAGVRLCHIPVVSSAALGITHEGGLAGLIHEARDFQHDALGKMERLYRQIVLSREGQEGYGRFFRILLEQDRGMVLWHCTAGKDRTGIAAALLTIALGVPRTMVMESYLASNRYTEPLVSRALEDLSHAHVLAGVASVVHTLYRVSERYLNGALEAIEGEFGSVHGYLNGALGIDDADITRLRELYLEQGSR